MAPQRRVVTARGEYFEIGGGVRAVGLWSGGQRVFLGESLLAETYRTEKARLDSKNLHESSLDLCRNQQGANDVESKSEAYLGDLVVELGGGKR